MIVKAYLHRDPTRPIEYAWGGPLSAPPRATHVAVAHVPAPPGLKPQALAAQALAELRAVLGKPSKAESPVLELVLSPAPEDLLRTADLLGDREDVATAAAYLTSQLIRSVSEARQILGFSDHPYLLAVHADGHSRWKAATGRHDLPLTHVHVVQTRSSWTSPTAVPINALAERVWSAGRYIELEFGLMTQQETLAQSAQWQDLRRVMQVAWPSIKTVTDLLAVPHVEGYALTARSDGTLWVGSRASGLNSALGLIDARWTPEKVAAQVADSTPLTADLIAGAEQVLANLAAIPAGQAALGAYRQHLRSRAKDRAAYVRRRKKAKEKVDYDAAPTADGLEAFLAKEGLQQLLVDMLQAEEPAATSLGDLAPKPPHPPPAAHVAAQLQQRKAKRAGME